ncbi:MAG TPA: PPK2 family polyphosphate kinase [Blastocatellia bacterium]|nr:PPK2 family polyphosphate kinase [Blastocatellia bacterium]
MRIITRVEPGARVNLADHNPKDTSGFNEEKAAKRLRELSEELGKLQETLYAARQNSVLIVLQGMDTSGKDGTIKRVMSEVNPLGCRVESFKAPTEEELSHDFLWRVHARVPPVGFLTIFNRSHYEDVLVVRVHKLVPEEVWRKRYDHIKHFEQILADSNTIILKFFLHISLDEQQERLEAREEDAEKAWKLSAGDWKERKHWDEYMRAYEEAITHSAADHAPWHIIPANKKWFRNLAVAETIVETLKPYRTHWEEALDSLSKQKLAELQGMRSARNKTGAKD